MLKEFYKRHKSFLIVIIVILAYYIRHLTSFRLGINFEEPRDANAYLLALQGYLPYRDFEWTYGPFSFLFYPFIMKIFGVSLIVLRLSYIIFASLVIPLAFFLARKIMPPIWAGIAAFMSIVFFDIPYYAFGHIFVIIGGLASLLMISKFIERDRKISYLFLGGIFVAIAILTKPISMGISLFISVSLFLFLFRCLGPLRKRVLKEYAIFVVGTVFLISIFLLYFYYQTSLKNLPVKYPLLAEDSLIIIDHKYGFGNTDSFILLLERLKKFISLDGIIQVTSLTELKRCFVNFFDNLIFFLPFIISLLILFVFATCKLNRAKLDFKEKILHDKNFLLLFIIFSIFISLESLRVIHRFGRAYTIQVPFILTVYLLYLIKTYYKRTITLPLIILFLFFLSFLHFFRYPYSQIKKYKYPLNLDRARIFLTLPEKNLYESLSSYLSTNFKKEDKMAVIGYRGLYSQFSFLTQKKDVFEDKEFIFVELKDLLEVSEKREDVKPLLYSLENRIISRMEKDRTKIVLIITDDLSQELEDYNFLSLRIKYFLATNYSLTKVFGPADIQGLGGKIGWVKLYKLKEG